MFVVVVHLPPLHEAELVEESYDPHCWRARVLLQRTELKLTLRRRARRAHVKAILVMAVVFIVLVVGLMVCLSGASG